MGVSVVVDAQRGCAPLDRAGAPRRARVSISPTADGARARSSLEPCPERRGPGRASSSHRKPASRHGSSCPGRRLDAFDQYYSHRQKQKLVVANHTVRPESLPARLESGKVYVLDGRDRDATAMEVAVSDLDAQFGVRGCGRPRSGSCAEPVASLKFVGGSGSGGSGCRRVGPRRAGTRWRLADRRAASLPRWSAWGDAAMSHSPSTTDPTRHRRRGFSTRSTRSVGTPRSSCSGRWSRRDPGLAARGRRRRSRDRGPRRRPRKHAPAARRGTRRRHRPRPRQYRGGDRRRAALVPPTVRDLFVRVVACGAPLGMTTVLWTTWGATGGGKQRPTSVVDDVPRRYVDGGTVLLHDSDCTSSPGSWHSALGALPQFADRFAARGLEVGTVGEHGIFAGRLTRRVRTNRRRSGAIIAPS